MATLVRKNLMVDAEQLRELARRLDLNESQAVREAVERVLMAHQVEEAAEKIRRRGGLIDVFERVPKSKTRRRAAASRNTGDS
jgi:hypothetical protein